MAYRESSKPMQIKIVLTCAEAAEAIRDYFIKKGGTVPTFQNENTQLQRPEDPAPPWDWDNDHWVVMVISDKKVEAKIEAKTKSEVKT